jgi:Bardet-Biedl syndrome 7 protein
LTKKGKEFFKLTSSLTESINHVFVEETKIWTACEYIYNIYENGQDAGFFMCHDQIHSMAMEYILRQNDFDALLGCQDNTIRVVTGSTLGFEIGTSGPVMALCSMHGEDSKIQRSVNSILYGTNLGTISNVLITGRDSAPQWTIPDPSKASITALKASDITQDGALEFIVSRDDGRMEVYADDPSTGIPTRTFGRNIGESIRSIEVGRVNSVDFNEIVIAAYSGKVISFTSEPTQQRAPVSPPSPSLSVLTSQRTTPTGAPSKL